MKASFVVTGSQDCTVKVWDLPAEFSGEEIHQLSPRSTEKAHDKVQDNKTKKSQHFCGLFIILCCIFLYIFYVLPKCIQMLEENIGIVLYLMIDEKINKNKT